MVAEQTTVLRGAQTWKLKQNVCVFFKSIHYLHKDCEEPKTEEVGEDDAADTVEDAEEVEDNDDDSGAIRACLDDKLVKDLSSPVAKYKISTVSYTKAVIRLSSEMMRTIVYNV